MTILCRLLATFLSLKFCRNKLILEATGDSSVSYVTMSKVTNKIQWNWPQRILPTAGKTVEPPPCTGMVVSDVNTAHCFCVCVLETQRKSLMEVKCLGRVWTAAKLLYPGGQGPARIPGTIINKFVCPLHKLAGSSFPKKDSVPWGGPVCHPLGDLAPQWMGKRIYFYSSCFHFHGTETV